MVAPVVITSSINKIGRLDKSMPTGKVTEKAFFKMSCLLRALCFANEGV